MKENKKDKIVRYKAKASPDDVLTKAEKEDCTGEIGGPKGLEPTRFGDWEKNGRCSDF
jgi:hypothetical protein